MQQLQTFWQQLRREQAGARGIAPGSVQADNETEVDRIKTTHEQDRNGFCCLHRCLGGNETSRRDDDADPLLNQLVRQRLKSVVITVCPRGNNLYVASIDKTQFAHTLKIGLDERIEGLRRAAA